MGRPTPPTYKTRNWPSYNKALTGQRLSARDFARQVAEFQVWVAVLSRFSALGTPVTKVAG